MPSRRDQTPPGEFDGVLVISTLNTAMERNALRAFVVAWVTLAFGSVEHILEWDLALRERANEVYPNVRHIIVSGHGSAEGASAGPYAPDPEIPPLTPEDLHRLCPGARRIDMWVCYQALHETAWQRPYLDAGCEPPVIVGYPDQVLGPWDVPDQLADAWNALRERLRL